MYAKTTFAAITIGGVVGPITVEYQNASVMVDAKSAKRCQPVSILTSYGPIRFTVTPGAGYNVTARTTFGSIHSDPGIAAEVRGGSGPDAITGKIGAGGCDLHLMNQTSLFLGPFQGLVSASIGAFFVKSKA